MSKKKKRKTTTTIINNLQGVTHIIIKLAVNYYQQKMATLLTVYDNCLAFIRINDNTVA